MITEEQLAKDREPIPYIPVKQLRRDRPLYVMKQTRPHPIRGYGNSHDEFSVVDIRGYRKGYEPRLDILGQYTPNPHDLFRLGTGRLPPYQPTATGDKLQAEMERLQVHKAWRINPIARGNPMTPEEVTKPRAVVRYKRNYGKERSVNFVEYEYGGERYITGTVVRETDRSLGWYFGKGKEGLREANRIALLSDEEFSKAEDLKKYSWRETLKSISEAKPVPAEVLKDYPDLAKKHSNPEAVPEVTPLLKDGVELEGRIFGGSYDISRLRFADRTAAIRKDIPNAQKKYNEIRAAQGLEPVTDWAKRPDVTLEQQLRAFLKAEPKPPAVKEGSNPHLMPENVPEEDFTTVTDAGSIYDLFSEGKISLRELDRLKDHYYKWYYSPEQHTTVLRFYRQPDGTMTIYKQVYVQTYGESGNPKPQAAEPKRYIIKGEPEGLVDVSQLKALDLPNVRLAGSYATSRATPRSDIDILIGLTDAEWDKVTPRTPPAVLEKMYSILPEEKMSPMLYKLSDVKDMWFFKRGRKGISGAFVPINDAEMVQGLWNSSIGLKEIHKPPAVEEVKLGGGNPIPKELDLARTLAIIDSRPKGRIIESKLREEFGDAVIDALRQGRYVVSGSAGYNPPLLVSLKGRELIQGRNPEREVVPAVPEVIEIPELSRLEAEKAVQGLVNELRQVRQQRLEGTISQDKFLTQQRDIAQRAIEVEPLDIAKETWRGILARTEAELAKPPAVEVPAVPEVRESWQMTKEEFVADPDNPLLLRKSVEFRENLHKSRVFTALKEGKPVPPEVLADYPDLRTREGNPDTGTSIIDLRGDYDEIAHVKDGILYRKGNIVQVWWDKWGKETWTGPSKEQARENFNAMKERWSSSELGNPMGKAITKEEAIGLLERLSMTPGEAARSLVADEAERRELIQTVQQRVQREQNKWAPMDPRTGPPLPRVFAGLRWPWKK